MKQLLLLSAIVVFFSMSFRLPEKAFIPSYTVKINDTLFIGETEVAIKDWKVFQLWHEKYSGKTSEAYKMTILDSTVWKEELNDYKEYVNQYFNNEKFSDHPIVGVSYEQAREYCKWLSERMQDTYAEDKSVKAELLEYRLPKAAEWELAAKAGYSGKFQKAIEKRDYEFHRLHNVLRRGNASEKRDISPDATITAPVKTYFPIEYGAFNLIGNVAEMTATKGIAKGGGWNHTEEEISIEKTFNYDAPKAWLGFRCVCEIKEE